MGNFYSGIGKFFAGIFMIALAALLLAIPVWLLWNWLMPELLGLKTIDLAQALGLNLLCAILFKVNNPSAPAKPKPKEK